MSWIPLDYLIQQIRERRFNWLTDTRLKYMSIRFDARDDHAVLCDREGHVVAQTVDELNDLFGKLNHKAKSSSGVYDRKSQQEFYKRAEDAPDGSSDGGSR